MDVRCLASPSEELGDGWYIHLFTVVYTERADTLSIYWYKSPNVNRELFKDMQLMLERMKEYRLCASYTGDVMCVPEERVFLEKLALLGLQMSTTTTYDWPLQCGGSLEIEGGVCSHPIYFQQMSGLCFQDYDVWHSFSSTDPSEPVRLVPKHQAAPVAPVEPVEEEARLMFVSVFGCSVLFAWFPLAITGYSVFHCAIENRQLYTWFVSMVQQRQYPLAKQQIAALEYYHIQHPVLSSPFVAPVPLEEVEKAEGTGKTEEAEEAEGTGKTEETGETEEKSEIAVNGKAFVPRSLEELDSPVFWVRTFCELYLEESTDHDTLLSEIYQDYLTFSEWGEREKLVSMTAFIKTLRASGRYTIKRRSKGMTLVGHRSLVSQQGALRDAALRGQGYERNLLQYRSAQDMHVILANYEELIEYCSPIYSREACLVLHDRGLVLDDAILYSFCRIPGITEELAKYADYLDRLLARPLTMDHQTDYEEFRSFAEQCVLYYPFQLCEGRVVGQTGSVTAVEEAPEVTLDEQFHGLSLGEGGSGGEDSS